MAPLALADRFRALLSRKSPQLPPQPDPLRPGAQGTRTPELQPLDFVPRREIYPLFAISGWDGNRILNAIDNFDNGNFSDAELLYLSMRKEGLIASALNTRVSLIREFQWDLVVPKDAPEEFHALSDMLKRDWQQVLSDEDRGEVDERMIMFGFSVCSVSWTFCNGQKQPRLRPWTHSSLSWRWDWYNFQGISQDGGIERIVNDGRSWVVFSKGGLRPWMKGAIRELAYVWFGLMTGDEGWLSLNDGFGRPIKKWKTPRLTRESREALDGYNKVQALRAADTAMTPQDEKGYGYDLTYVQAEAQGYQTFAEQLKRYDDRVAIILLGHNLSQRVSSGSLAATKEATGITRLLAEADARILSTGFDTISQVWARANFGELDEYDAEYPKPPEAYSWKFVFHTTPPEDKKEASQAANSFATGMASFAKQIDIGRLPIDLERSAERAGFVLLPPEQREAFRLLIERQQKAAEAAAPPAEAGPARNDAAVRVPPGPGSPPTPPAAPEKPEKPDPEPADSELADEAEPTVLLASGDSAASAMGYLEGQRQVDALADEPSEVPGLAAALAALAAAADWGDLRERLAGIVATADTRDYQRELAARIQAADHIGTESVDHDLPASARTEVDAADRRRTQAEKVAELRTQQERSHTAARASAAYAVYAVARHLWDAAATAEAGGQPIAVHREELAALLSGAWGPNSVLWSTARAEPLQAAFTHARAQRLGSEPVRAVLPYWILDAVLDGRTTPLCRSLDGYTRPANDPGFPIPPLHWHCRTTIRGISRAEGEARVSAPAAWPVEPGFGSLDALPAPQDGPEPLLTAYRRQLGGRRTTLLSAALPQQPEQLPAIVRRALRRAQKVTHATDAQ